MDMLVGKQDSVNNRTVAFSSQMPVAVASGEAAHPTKRAGSVLRTNDRDLMS